MYEAKLDSTMQVTGTAMAEAELYKSLNLRISVHGKGRNVMMRLRFGKWHCPTYDNVHTTLLGPSKLPCS